MMGRPTDKEDSADNDAVKVIVRIKPQSANDKGRSAIRQTSEFNLTCGPDAQIYTFDKVAGPTSAQVEIFEAAGEPLVDRCLEGFNCCIFTYGQTGSGKTWTMWGQLPRTDIPEYMPPEAGLIPRMYQKLFTRIAQEEAKTGGTVKFSCQCSIVEIYNETITDLLNPDSGNLPIRESKKDGVFIEGVSQRRIKDVGGVLVLVNEGNANRQVAETNMNRESSRSHVVLICTISWKMTDENGIVTTKCSRLNLVDLAGSERQKSTGAKGDRLKEACGINKSLSTLGHVIMSLADQQQGKEKHVPYRDSKLTFLLQDSLGGNSKTVMIANMSPAIKNMEETLSTLRFARGAKKIKNKAVINESCGGDVTALREEIARLKAEVAQLKYREAERLAKGPAANPPAGESSLDIQGGSTTTFTLSDSRSDLMEDFDEVYTLRVEKNCPACRDLKYLVKEVWAEKGEILEDSILLAAQLTAARLEIDALRDEGCRAVEREKRQGDEIIAQLNAELEIVKNAQREESHNAVKINHIQAKMSMARRKSMKVVHSTSRDWTSDSASNPETSMSEEQSISKQLTYERNVLETYFSGEADNEAEDSQAYSTEEPDSPAPSMPVTALTASPTPREEEATPREEEVTPREEEVHPSSARSWQVGGSKDFDIVGGAVETSEVSESELTETEGEEDGAVKGFQIDIQPFATGSRDADESEEEMSEGIPVKDVNELGGKKDIEENIDAVEESRDDVSQDGSDAFTVIICDSESLGSNGSSEFFYASVDDEQFESGKERFEVERFEVERVDDEKEELQDMGVIHQVAPRRASIAEIIPVTPIDTEVASSNENPVKNRRECCFWGRKSR